MKTNNCFINVNCDCVINQKCCILDLPPDAQLDDLVRLSTLDSTNFKEDEQGDELIRDQLRHNQEFSSEECATLPEDSAQKLLVSVSIHSLQV